MMGFFRGNGANVFLTKHDDGTTLAFVVVGEAWNNPTKVNSLEAIVREIAPTVGGLPLNMRLVDTQLQIKKEELIQSVETMDRSSLLSLFKRVGFLVPIAGMPPSIQMTFL